MSVHAALSTSVSTCSMSGRTAESEHSAMRLSNWHIVPEHTHLDTTAIHKLHPQAATSSSPSRAGVGKAIPHTERLWASFRACRRAMVFGCADGADDCVASLLEKGIA